MKNTTAFLSCIIAILFTGCALTETPDARVTLSAPHVATERGLMPESDMEPGTYALNQVLEPGVYTRSEVQAFAPGPLPRSIQIEAGESASQVELILQSLGAIAASVPGGQPIGTLLLGAAGIAKIWRDRRTIKDTRRVAETLARSRDSALDVIATLPDREQARNLERQIEEHTAHFARNLGHARDLLDAILKETETPTKKPIHAN